MIGGPNLRYVRVEPPLAQCIITVPVVVFWCACSACPSFFGGSDGCDGNGCNVAGCDGGGSDGCDGCGSDGRDITGCDGVGSDGCDGGGSDGCDITDCDGGGSDGGVYVLVNPGVVVGAAASTYPTEPPAPADAGNGRTGVRGTIHTMSLELRTPPVELLRTFTVDEEWL